ncbi:marine proteobacterial sortase target protein [Gammaproteobacteria bacterium 45_16_T64]|nr:marine proteobacterial sortase target protein [Gammaproteobacteria bacterium 45_16_T64]
MSSTNNWDRTSVVELVVSALFVGVLLVLAPMSYAETSFEQESHGSLKDFGSGALVVADSVVGYRALLRLDAEFDLVVSGMVVQATVKQVFVNNTEQWLEGQYVFPLPSDSAVNGLTIRLGERLIRGEIKEKEIARKMFVKARNDGKVATLVEQQRPNLFTNRVTNIAPGERIEVTLTYLQTLTYDSGEFSLRIPMTLTPRYIPGKSNASHRTSTLQGQGWAFNTDQVSDANDITPQQQNEVKHKASVHIALSSGFDLAEIQAPFHDVHTDRVGGVYHVRLKQPGAVMNRDFVLRWRPVLDEAPVAAFFTESVVDDVSANIEHHGLLMMMPPSTTYPIQGLPRELILVIDTSGSMAGTSIEQAKQALLVALERLTDRDTFNVIEFNSTTHQLFETSVVANAQNILAARRYVKGLDANGGTEMKGALNAALSLHPTHEMSAVRQVVFITDGSVGNEAALLNLIATQVKGSRLFTVAIGAAPNGYFMKKAAQYGKGTYTFIGDTFEVRKSITALFEKIEKPMLTNVKVKFHNSGVTEFYPGNIPDLYDGEPLLLFVQMAEKTDTITVSGEFEGRYWERDIIPNWSFDHPGIGALWGRQKIQALMDESVQQGNRDYHRKEIVDLGLFYKLVSRYTSFIAVDATVMRNNLDTLAVHAIANNLPQGSRQGIPSVGYPKTALGINGILFMGALSLFLGVLVLCLKQDSRIVRIKYAVRRENY